MFCIPALADSKFDPQFHWHTIETKHFIYHYSDGLEPMAQEMAQYGEKMQAEVSGFFNWYPKAKTQVIISDQMDSANGYAMVLPRNRIEIFATPPSTVNSLEDFYNWKRLVFKHEYTHIVQIDMAKDFPRDMRNILGRWLFLFPGEYMPSWLHEGIAVYMETDTKLGVGRGQSNYFRGLMRNELLHGFKSLGSVNHIPLVWPGGTTSYLYGAYFFNFLHDRYGDAKIKKFFRFYSSIPVPYFLNYTAWRSFGYNFRDLWTQFEVYLHQEFDAQLAAVKSSKYVSKSISQSGYYSGFSRVTKAGNVLYLDNDLIHKSRLMIYDPRTKHSKLLFQLGTQSFSEFSRFDYHPDSGVLIPMTDMKNNARLPTDLYVLNLKTLKLKRLTYDKRFIQACWSPDGSSIAAIQVNRGQHKLVLLDKFGKEKSVLSVPGKDVLISSVDWSPAHDYLVSTLFRPGTGWNLELFDLRKKQWIKLTHNQSIETDPQFDSTGQKFLFSADYNGTYNIYEYQLKTHQISLLTQTPTVALSPVYSVDDTKIYFADLDQNGFNLHQGDRTVIKNINLAVEPPLIVPENPIKYPVSRARTYSGLKNLKPTFWFPVVQSTNGVSAFGFLTHSTTPLFWHNYNMQLTYEPRYENPGWYFSYTYIRYKPNFLFASQRDTSYANNQIFAVHLLQNFVGIQRPFLSNNIRIGSRIGVQSNKRTVDIYTTRPLIILTQPDSQNLVLSLSADTRTIRPRAFLSYDGYYLSGTYENFNLREAIKHYSRLTLMAKYASPLFLGINVFDVKAQAVVAGGLADYVGLSGNIQDTYQGFFTQQIYSLPGYNLGLLNATNLQKIQANWNILAGQPRYSMMIPPFGVSTIYFRGYALAARVGDFNTITSTPWKRAIGLETIIKGDFGYGNWPLSLTAGIAKGLDEGSQLTTYYQLKLDY